LSARRVLETPRLALRELNAGDAGFMLALLNDPDWIRYIGDRGVRTVEEASQYLDERLVSMYARLGFGLWGVELRGRRELIGICGLIKRDTLESVDLGFAFMPVHRGRGYAYESALASRDYGIRTLGLDRLLAIATPINLASVRLLEKLGFRHERDMPWQGDAKDPVSVYAYVPSEAGARPRR
jgi:RimJ/RimL family protein N-acetyltransferase